MFGLNIDPNNSRGNPTPAELRELGVQTVRYTFYDSSGGNQIDPQKAAFYTERVRSYSEAGISSLIILTYDTYPNRPVPEADNPQWDQYIDRFVRRANQIAALLRQWRPSFQVWNEPDHPVTSGYVPTLREDVFGRMLQRTYDAIKMVDAGLPVITAGLASGNPSWLTRVIRELGGRLPADAVAFHPYGQRPEPNWPHPNWGFGYVGNLLNAYYQAGQRKPLWITEMGIKEEDVGGNREQAAEFLRRYYRTIFNNFSDKVQQFQWFCYSDGMVPTFGLLDAAGNRKPIYTAYHDIVQTLRPTPVPPQPPAPPPPPPPPPPPVPATTGPDPQLVAQLIGQLSGMQNQTQQLQNLATQLAQQLQQLTAQQTQVNELLKQLVTQLGGAVAPPAIQDITGQLPKHSTKQFPSRPLSQIQRIIVHHTAIAPDIGAERIASHRVSRQDWPGIGYHYFITADGTIQQTNALTTQATHAGPYDPVAVGVCFAGDFTNTTPTQAQIEAGARLIAWLLAQFNLPVEAVAGYKELINTQSPGQQWDNGARWGEQLRARIRTLLGQ